MMAREMGIDIWDPHDSDLEVHGLSTVPAPSMPTSSRTLALCIGCFLSTPSFSRTLLHVHGFRAASLLSS